MIHETALAARVYGVNNAHRVAMLIYPELREALAPFVGQKILKADGTLLKKIAELIPKISNYDGISIYKSISDYNINWSVKSCEQSQSRNSYEGHTNTYYYEIGVYVGDIRDGILIRLYDPPIHKTDYTVEEVLRNRETFKVAEKIYQDAKSSLFPFGEYDR